MDSISKPSLVFNQSLLSSKRDVPASFVVWNVDTASDRKRIRSDHNYCRESSLFAVADCQGTGSSAGEGRPSTSRVKKADSNKYKSSLNIWTELSKKLDDIEQYDPSSSVHRPRDRLLSSLIWFALAREKNRLETHTDNEERSPLKNLETIVIDGILKGKKFCNIRREDDRGTKNLLKSHGVWVPEDRTSLSKDQFNNLLYRTLLGRFMHDSEKLEKLGAIDCRNTDPMKEAFQNLRKPKISGAYQVNPQYACLGATLEDVLFTWLPKTVIKADLHNLRSGSIETAIGEFHKHLPEVIEAWFGEEVRVLVGTDKKEKHFRLDKTAKTVVCKTGEKQSVTKLSSFRMPFIFSQGLMDFAVLETGHINPESSPIPGPGAKMAIDILCKANNTKKKEGYCAALEHLKDELTASNLWPIDYLKVLDAKTLEHTLCEWLQWLKIRYLGHRGTPYKPHQSS